MKKQILIILLLIFCQISQSQNIVEKKVIYSTPGSSIKLSNAYGVNQLKGIAFDNYASSTVEMVDLFDKGYLLRSNYKIVLFDNDFKKISEHDLKESIYEANGNQFEFYPSKNGVWLIHDVDGSPKEIKLGLLSYNGQLKVETVLLPERYLDYLAYFDDSQDAFIISTEFLRGNTKTKTEFIFTDSPANYKKTEGSEVKKKEEEFNEAKPDEKRAELKFYQLYTSPSGKLYFTTLTTKDLAGNSEIMITHDDTVKKFQIPIPEYKELKNRSVAIKYSGDYEIMVDEKTNDFYVFHSVLDAFKVYEIILIKGNFNSEHIKTRIIKNAEFEKYGIPYKYIGGYSISCKMFNSDQAIYEQNDYFLLDFHSKSGIGNKIVRTIGADNGVERNNTSGAASGLTVRNIYELTISKDLEIMKSSFLNHNYNCLKHRQLKMAPKKMEVLYQAPNYKKQESDFIYDEIGKVKPDENLYRIIQKNEHSYIINFKETNSEVEVWKVKF